MKSRLLLLCMLQLFPFKDLVAQSLWVGETYDCFIEDYADRRYDWKNISWDIDYGLYQDYYGTYVRKVSFHEFTSGTKKVTANWSETDMGDFSDPIRHKSHTWSFTCKDNPIVLDKSNINLYVGDTESIKYSFTYNNSYTSKAIISYKSSNTSVVTVSIDGKLTALSEGEATIFVSSSISEYSEECTVTVSSKTILVSKITLNKTSVTLDQKQQEQLTATIEPEDATNKDVKWESSNSNVATVNNTGLVTAVAEGSATITCTAEDGSGVKAVCEVSVLPESQEADISFVSVTCDNINLADLTNNDILSFHATFENLGDATEISTALFVCDQSMKIVGYSEWDNRLFDANSQVSIDYEYALDAIPLGDYIASVMYYDKNEESIIYNESYLFPITIKTKSIEEEFVEGDVNQDGSVNGTDLVALSNVILGRKEETVSADVNQDGSVSGTDIVALVNIILRKSNSGTRHFSINGNKLSIQPFEIRAGEEKEILIDMVNPDDITLVQFDMHLPKGITIKNSGSNYEYDMANRTSWKNHSLEINETDNAYRFLLYSSGNALIDGNSGAIVKVKLVADDSFDGGKTMIDNVLLVSPDEKEINPINFEYTTGITNIVKDENVSSTIYNLYGQKVSTPQKGIMIIGGRKLIIK